MKRLRPAFRVWVALSIVLGLGLSACHSNEEMTPLIDRKIYLTDKFFSVTPVSTKQVFVWGYGGKILSTPDGGRNWSVVASGTDTALYDAYFADETKGWAVGMEGTILATTDGGASWSPVESGTEKYLFAVASPKPGTLIAVGEASTVMRSDDDGATWEVVEFSSGGDTLTEEERMVLQDPSYYDVQFLSPEVGWIVGEFGQILKTTDGGVNWVEQQGTLVGDEILSALDLPTFYGVDFIDEQHGIATGLAGHIAETDDGGATWRFSKVDDTLRATPFFNGQILSDGSAWAVGAAGTVVRRASRDGVWEPADLGMRVHAWFRGLHFVDDQHGWITGGLGLIFYTRDGGETWFPAAA